MFSFISTPPPKTRMWEFVVNCLYDLAHDKQSNSNKNCVCINSSSSYLSSILLVLVGDSLPLSFYVVFMYLS